MSRKILVVEDDVSIREAMAECLQIMGYHVLTATNGYEALDVLNLPEKPELILLDITMPMMDGREFMSRQLQNTELASIPVIVVSADGNARQKAREMGAQGGLKKPVKFADLRVAVEAYCPRQ